MGCGKTLTAITIAGCLYERQLIKRVLVVAPSSVVPVWGKDLEEYAAFDYECVPLVGTMTKRLGHLEGLVQSPRNCLKVASINYESARRPEMLRALAAYDADLIICDESQRIKTHNASQSKALHALGDMARYKLILSGTPITQNLVDVYSQYRFLDKSVFGSNFYAFKNRYCIMGGYGRHQVIGFKNEDEFQEKMHSVALRVTKEEALDLPEQTFERRYIDFDAKSQKLYDELKRTAVAELEKEGTVTAQTVLVKLLRLQSLTGGFIRPDDTDKVVEVGHEKLDALKDILEDYVLEGCGKLVVFARFTPEIKAIEKLLERLKIGYGAIHGGIPADERGGIVKDFQENDDTKVFVAQLQCAGLGITLTAAHTAVYFSLNFNYADYAQSLARIHRIGQKNKCHYIHLLIRNSIDDKCLKALEAKEGIARKLVDDWRSLM